MPFLSYCKSKRPESGSSANIGGGYELASNGERLFSLGETPERIDSYKDRRYSGKAEISRRVSCPCKIRRMRRAVCWVKSYPASLSKKPLTTAEGSFRVASSKSPRVKADPFRN